MSKRKQEEEFYGTQQKKVQNSRFQVKKHTLDSDEEDDVDEDNVLDVDDIEGEEDGVDRQDDGQRMTAFNMKEEMEEGHFDKQGHFIWSNEKEIKDNWLDNIDWQQIKSNASFKDKYNIDNKGLGDDSESDSEPEPDFDEFGTYKKIIGYMKPKETINKAIKRLSGDLMKLSSLERLKRKKAGTLNSNEDVTNLTELANSVLSKLGNMDVYQETFEQIQAKINMHERKGKAKEPELDMYADDFDTKEQEKMAAGPSNVESSSSMDTEVNPPQELRWEFKWKAEDDDKDIQGPYTTAQMVKWAKENHFKTGVLVRKCGESSNFYSSNRIDFELYE
ncbi:CD2 antigen cytoplasmic tail-binding protein 2 homolog [Aethina tumida]|uniref:CD2 antigen cytoplasmic tail-binding protein 2 homolog n=1 Tax=Aethina tumida TaxID=116153 RepID=UPI002148294B|nr:CD2 antigen cytoplasmic tail-binding protein 2 homolog [Aethina tumida]